MGGQDKDEIELPTEVWLAQEKAAKDIFNLWAPDAPPALRQAIHAAMSRSWKSGWISARMAPK